MHLILEIWRYVCITCYCCENMNLIKLIGCWWCWPLLNMIFWITSMWYLFLTTLFSSQHGGCFKIMFLMPKQSLRWIHAINSLRPRQNGRHFADHIFKCIFLNENASIAIKISLKFVPKGPINNIPAMVQIMAWRRPGDKALSEPMMVSLLTHICVTRPQWVNTNYP